MWGISQFVVLIGLPPQCVCLSQIAEWSSFLLSHFASSAEGVFFAAAAGPPSPGSWCFFAIGPSWHGAVCVIFLSLECRWDCSAVGAGWEGSVGFFAVKNKDTRAKQKAAPATTAKIPQQQNSPFACDQLCCACVSSRRCAFTQDKWRYNFRH